MVRVHQCPYSAEQPPPLLTSFTTLQACSGLDNKNEEHLR